MRRPNAQRGARTAISISCGRVGHEAPQVGSLPRELLVPGGRGQQMTETDISELLRRNLLIQHLQDQVIWNNELAGFEP
jgi:hypothetical protein